MKTVRIIRKHERSCVGREWVETELQVSADRLARRNPRMYEKRWRVWVCNSGCRGYAIVSDRVQLDVIAAEERRLAALAHPRRPGVVTRTDALDSFGFTDDDFPGLEPVGWEPPESLTATQVLELAANPDKLGSEVLG